MRAPCLLTLVALLLPAQASAAEPDLPLPPPAPAAPEPRNPGGVAVSVSGGASLGAYEAGYLYYVTQSMSDSGTRGPLRLMAGASAGSINALLTIITVYGESPRTRPEDSLYWRVWIPLSVQRLFRPKETTAVSLLSRSPLEGVADMVEEVWKHGLSEDCDVMWAVPTTRLRPRSVGLGQGSLELPRTEEKFVVRIRGRGPGKPPSVRNYIDGRPGLEQATLVTDAQGEVPYSALKELIFASSAFPAAFAPQRMRYCLTAQGDATCLPEAAIDGLFVDGGVLDNAPLRLAVRTLGGGLRPGPDGKLAWLERPKLDEMQVPKEVILGFISPESADYPTYEAGGVERMPESFLSLAVQFAGSFMAVARSKELYTLIEERPELRHLIYISRRRVPTFSALLGEFLGFFERDFRVFDFALGMLEARRNMAERVERATRQHEAAPTLHVLDKGGDVSDAWAQFACLDAALNAAPGATLPAEACAGATRNQRILAQVALTRLYDNCARLEGVTLQKTHNPHCLAAARGELPPRVLQDADTVTWRSTAHEPELRYLLRLLSDHGFAFHDMGLPAADADRAPMRLREMLDDLASAYASDQPGADRRIVGMAARVAIDAVTQSPTRLMWFATLAEMLEGGASWLLPLGSNQLLRLNGTLLLDGLGRLLTSDGGKLSLGAAAGLELEQDMADSLLQVRGILRAGYMFGQGDAFTAHACRDRPHERLGDCSRMVAQLAVGATVLENLRLQVAGSWYPPLRSDERSLWAVTPGVGLQF